MLELLINVVDVLKELNELCVHVNKIVSAHDGAIKVRLWSCHVMMTPQALMVQGLFSDVAIVAPGRQLLMQGVLNQMDFDCRVRCFVLSQFKPQSKARAVFLFSDLLLLAREMNDGFPIHEKDSLMTSDR